MMTENQLEILEDKAALTYTDMMPLTEAVGWGKMYFPSADKLQHILTKSSHVAYIKDKSNIIAFGRVIEDGMMCMFYDICVHPDYQRKRIGSKIMNHLIDKIKHTKYVSIGLFVWSGNRTAANFYSRFGFEQSVAMELQLA